MNYIDIALIFIVLLFAFVGINRGFLLTVLHFGSSIIAGIASKIFSSPVAEYFYISFVKQSVIDKLYKIMPSGSIKGELQTVIDKAFASLPDAVSNAANQFGFYPDVSKVSSTSGTFTVEYIENNILSPIIQKIIAMLAMIILFTLFVFILRFLCHFINKLITNKKKHNIINKSNKILGGIFGALKGVIPAGLAAIAVNLAASYSDNTEFLASASDSVICSFISQILQ